MTQRKEAIQDTITLLQQAKYLLEKELQYDCSVTDEIEKIIESLEFDLGDEGNCTTCQKGTMKEMSIYDDMDGMLTCDKCGVRVKN